MRLAQECRVPSGPECRVESARECRAPAGQQLARSLLPEPKPSGRPVVVPAPVEPVMPAAVAESESQEDAAPRNQPVAGAMFPPEEDEEASHGNVQDWQPVRILKPWRHRYPKASPPGLCRRPNRKPDPPCSYPASTLWPVPKTRSCPESASIHGQPQARLRDLRWNDPKNPRLLPQIHRSPGTICVVRPECCPQWPACL